MTVVAPFPSDDRNVASHRRGRRSFYPVGRLVWPVPVFLFTCLLTSCASIKVPPRKVGFVVRDLYQDTLLPGARIDIFHQDTPDQKDSCFTNGLGYAEFRCKKVIPRPAVKKEDRIMEYYLKWSKDYTLDGIENHVWDTVRLTRLLDMYELYLTPPGGEWVPRPPVDSVADMHYHVSMRAHNHFGANLYGHWPEYETYSPKNISWYKNSRKLRVFHRGKWVKPYLGRLNARAIAKKEPRAMYKQAKMQTLLEGRWVRSKGGSNQLTHHTQATHPHIREGNVFLAFNAFSPFEKSISSTWRNRFALKYFATGASCAWLNRIGSKLNDGDKNVEKKKNRKRLTHWDNFNLEYKMITSQDTAYNSFDWQFYTRNTDLKSPAGIKPTVVNVIEGSHALQHFMFPHIFKHIKSENDRIRFQAETLQRIVNHKCLSSSGRECTDIEKQNYLQDTLKLELVYSKFLSSTTFYGIDSSGKVNIDFLSRIIRHNGEKPDSIIKAILMAELEGNIDSLKRLDPPIGMVTIAHLSYNGMMSHSPNVDGGKFLNKIVAQKNYNIRVSDDPSYTSQWEKVFYNVPGVNAYGKAVIKALLSKDTGHRIMIDLKHSDLITRNYFYANVMYGTTGPDGKTDTIPPICSHCAATGLSKEYFSPFVNEFSLRSAPFTHTFNPFGINLYDEEIETICQNNGIIGLQLEQRMLGGYLNKKQLRHYFITRKGELKNTVPDESDEPEGGETQLIRRRNNIKRWLTYYAVEDSICMGSALKYLSDEMGILPDTGRKEKFKQVKPQLKVLYKQYVSAEPFLQNLFYIVDHSGYADPVKAWKHICIGSDLDGLIDPIDVCPTASQYPEFKKMLKAFIPVFLQMRMDMIKGEMKKKPQPYTHYFPATGDIDDALNQVFYRSLRDFTHTYFLKTQNPGI